jgi:phosphoglucosamine mutase
MTIGEKIAHLRTASQISQEQLAEKLTVSRQSVSKWETDQSIPEVDKVLQLSGLFHISTDELLRDDLTLQPTIAERAAVLNGNITFESKYFGTDGFRGEANETITSYQAYQIGRFLGWYYANYLSGCREFNYRPRIVIGKDTRRSSYMFEYSIVAGLTASGADAYMLHVTTTPSVSYVARQEHFDCGIMISASHNLYYDNGIKLVNSSGEKMDDFTLSLIEAYLDGNLKSIGIDDGDLPLAKRERLGCIVDYSAGRNRYVGYLISIAAHSYKNIRIGLDCANGSAWMIAKAVFDALGAATFVINAQPDGTNINSNAGSTHLEVLRKYVRDNHLAVGFAFDGDADRCLAVDEYGNEVNGDHILYILARRLQSKNILEHNTVATTIMSNMGLYRALKEAGIEYIQTAVGDRYVYESMVENGYRLGGEQSGHIILQKYATTGDGILTAIMLMEEILDQKLSLSKLASPVTILPQVLKNIRVADKSAVAADELIQGKIAEITKELDGRGRILLRESGTEPVIREWLNAMNIKPVKCMLIK